MLIAIRALFVLKMLSPTKADIDGFYNDYKSLFLGNHSLIEDDARRLRELKADLLIVLFCV